MPTKFYAQLLTLLILATACTPASSQNETSTDETAASSTTAVARMATEQSSVPRQGELIFVEFFAGT